MEKQILFALALLFSVGVMAQEKKDREITKEVKKEYRQKSHHNKTKSNFSKHKKGPKEEMSKKGNRAHKNAAHNNNHHTHSKRNHQAITPEAKASKMESRMKHMDSQYEKSIQRIENNSNLSASEKKEKKEAITSNYKAKKAGMKNRMENKNSKSIK